MAKMEYLQCPLCGWRRPIKYGVKQRDSGRLREVRFDKVDVENVKVWQVYELTSEGRGKGRMMLADYKLLQELPEEIKSQIINQCKKILKILET